MSRNLVIKHMFAVVDPEDKRVIDTNTLMQKRMEELAEKMKQPVNEGFVAGLNAEEVQGLLEDENGDAVSEGNILKANEEAAQILEQAKAEATKSKLREKRHSYSRRLRNSIYCKNILKCIASFVIA